ncbi:MAG TPA: metalloregulator ArsR/SmtB family transcription factor [Anaerolineales bacterium]
MNDTLGISKPPEFFKLLGHEIRWRLLEALSVTDLHVQEMVEAVNQPQNLVSYHLRKLHDHGLIDEHRSIADSREVYYSINLDQITDLYLTSGQALHPAVCGERLSMDRLKELEEKVRVLFLCTHNSARSQIAEGILRAHSNGMVEVFSAGTEPGQVHPMAIHAMAEIGIDIGDQHSKSLDEFIGQRFDYIITVCDRARENCPVFPGDPVLIHWSFPDPLEVGGSEELRYYAFRQTALQMRTRIGYLIVQLQRQFGTVAANENQPEY